MEIVDRDFRAWRTVSNYYDNALLAKASKLKQEKKNDLTELDSWYQTVLPREIGERKPKFITHEELCKLMKWKLLRGKFRPRLTEMVKTNLEKEVKDASTKAFQSLPDVSAAIQALSVLKAVGPATASGVLAAGSPSQVAFMADESMQAFPELQPIKYDLPFYREYMKHIKKIVKRLNTEDPEKNWTPHKVELTLWTYQIAKTLDKDLHNKITEAIESSNIEGPPKKKLKA